MKTLLTIIIIAALGFGAWKLIQTNPESDVPSATVSDVTATNTIPQAESTNISGKQIDNANVKIAFTGFGPGKKHDGSFSDVRSNLKLDAKGDVTGTLTVGVGSLTTDTEAVTKHLKTDAFFDVVKYPTATFTLKSITNGTATGTFTIHGVTKDVSFPVTKTETEYSTTFTLNMKEFGIDQTFANETIELRVTVPLQ